MTRYIMDKITAIPVDDHPVVRAGIKSLIKHRCEITHRTNIMRKLKANNTAELVSMAVCNRLL
ncbi:MAG: hypothetical protein O2887_05785 [Bacteroidetes bacterium]|nr:hypothetical protein [Bacteroidota bacterium]